MHSPRKTLSRGGKPNICHSYSKLINWLADWQRTATILGCFKAKIQSKVIFASCSLWKMWQLGDFIYHIWCWRDTCTFLLLDVVKVVDLGYKTTFLIIQCWEEKVKISIPHWFSSSIIDQLNIDEKGTKREAGEVLVSGQCDFFLFLAHMRSVWGGHWWIINVGRIIGS